MLCVTLSKDNSNTLEMKTDYRVVSNWKGIWKIANCWRKVWRYQRDIQKP